MIVEPLEAGRARFARAFFEYEGGRFGGPQGPGLPRRRRGLPGGAGSRLPRPPPDRGRDADRHRPSPLDRPRPQAQHGTAGGEVLQPRARGRRHLAAARAGPRARRHRGRRAHPPPPRPRLGDLRVPRIDLHRQRAGVGGRDQRADPDAAGLPPRPLRPRGRLPDRRFRRGLRRLIRPLRANDGPVRRRLGAARLHAGPQPGPHVGAAGASAPGLRDPRRRRLHLAPVRRRPRAVARRPTVTCGAARCTRPRPTAGPTPTR